MRSLVIALVVALLALVHGLKSTNPWTCIPIQETVINEAMSWKTENCTMGDPLVEPPLLTVNYITVDLASNKVRPVPGVADPNVKLQPVPDMAKSSNPNFAVGINGGYFWRVDISGVWIDDVCRGKTRKEAEQPVDSSNSHPNYGIGDGLVKIDGVVKSNNCDCSGYSRPAVLTLDGRNSGIQVLHRGETVGNDVTNAIAAGPNLVSFNATSGESYIDIPADDDNINILEHAANTAVGLVLNKDGKADTLLLVTTDGSDECGPRDYTCGLNSKDLASMMKDKFNCGMAMSMDQGGSTTMWVKGVNPQRNGVVSRSHNTIPEDQDGPRNVANGLFVEILN